MNRTELGSGPLLAPSILSADFARLGEALAQIKESGAGLVHVDVMDGHFVPNLTIGPPVVASLRKATTVPLDVHLMIEAPGNWAADYLDAGADMISVHYEADTHLHRTVQAIRARGVRAGVALNPATPVSVLDALLPDLDHVLVMSVNPGFSGQQFIPGALDKVSRLRRESSERGLDLRIQVDGGVTGSNAAALVRAGADILVAGSAVFGQEDPVAAARELIAAMGGEGDR